jgi:hypothetical protein
MLSAVSRIIILAEKAQFERNEFEPARAGAGARVRFAMPRGRATKQGGDTVRGARQHQRIYIE